MTKRRDNYFLLIVFVALLTSVSGYAFAMASEDESEELPTPISFCDGSLIEGNSVLLESISFDLSDTNPAQSYLIAEGYEDLIFSFKEVSAPINFSLETQNEDTHCAGFSGDACMVRIKIEPSSEYVFEWARGFIDSDSTYIQTEKVNCSSGLLEIYQVIG